MKILLAEDNAIARKALAAGLSEEGYEVELAEDGEQALRLARSTHPDFLISDVLMPKMDGFSLCQAVRGDEELSDVPVIFYSATFLDPEDEALARSVGASGFIHKDSDPDSFQRQLQQLIELNSFGTPPTFNPSAEGRAEVHRRHQSALVAKLHKKVVELEAEKEALRESRSFLNHIVTTIPDVVFALKVPGFEPCYIAPEAERLIGYSGESVMGDTALWLQLVEEGERQRVLQELQRIVDDGKGGVITSRMRHKNGGFRWIEAHVSPRRNEAGEVVELVGSLSDVSKRVEAAEKLHQSERSLNTLFRNLPGMAYRCENRRDWRMEFVSDGVEALTGYTRMELEHNNRISYADLIHPDDRDSVWEEVQQALKEKRQFSISYRIMHRDGSIRWAWERGVGVRDEGEVEEHVEGFISDITLRKRAEGRLIASEQRYRLLFEMMSSGLAVHELVYDERGNAVDYRFLEVNPAFESLTGLRAEQVVGKRAREVMPDIEPEWLEDYIRVAQSGEPAHHVRYSAALDRYFDVLAYATEMDHFATLFADVTEQMRAEIEIKNLARFPEENPSPVLRINRDGEIIYSNPASREVLNYCRSKSPSGECNDLIEPAKQALASGKIDKFVYVADKGHYSFVVSPIEEGGYANLYGRDITRRVEATQQLERLNRVLRTLSKGNRSLIHATSEDELLEKVCNILVEEGGYPFVWFAYMEDASHLKPFVQCGMEGKAMQAWPGMLVAEEKGVRYVNEVLQQGEPVVADSQDATVWGDGLLQPPNEAGLSALLLLPIRYRERHFGLLGIFAPSSDVFNPMEMELLNEMAGDVAYGMQAQRTQLAHERSMERIQSTMLQTIEAVSITLEKRDPYTAGHQQRVVELAVAIAREMGMEEQRVEGLRLASLVHDIGKINVPAEILNRPGRLSEIEFGIIKSHPQVGYDILKGVEFDWPIATMVLQHHERCDGSGYPQGLKGEEIVPEARIIAVADVMEAITSHRPYRPGLGVDVALEEIEAGCGSRYDSDVVEACQRLFREKGFMWDYAVTP